MCYNTLAMTLVRRLIWDNWNVNHIARHQVTPEEVEEVCHGDHIVREAKKGKLLLIGPTPAGQMLAVVLGAEGDGIYYVVTARVADRKERRLYQAEKGGV